jgi:hypothetical protein
MNLVERAENFHLSNLFLVLFCQIKKLSTSTNQDIEIHYCAAKLLCLSKLLILFGVFQLKVLIKQERNKMLEIIVKSFCRDR